MGDFSKYYTGEKVAPILTLIIGGNHEASNYMWELYHGGFLAPNMYYLGAAGVVQFNGIRVAGLSGIYKSHDYRIGHYESLPYDQGSMRSIYHVRQYDVQRMLQYIERHGNYNGLMKRKPHFRQDAETGRLGSPPLLEVLKKVRPSWWFSGHMHVKFEAAFKHEDQVAAKAGASSSMAVVKEANPDEIQIDFEDDDDQVKAANPDEVQIVFEDDDDQAPQPQQSEPDSEASPPQASASPIQSRPGASETKFLALDKCLPKKDYLEIIDFPAPLDNNPPKFTFDPEWLGIVRATQQYFSRNKSQQSLPPDNVLRPLIEESVRWVKENVGENKDIAEVQAFAMTSPGPDPAFRGNRFPQPVSYTNPQTVAFCEMLGIPNNIN
ncbi:hypothetical protein FRC04_002789 [Tulasnella sp. 424]|nr:hypothetical protein FRC04_002789 [Tulasnella sp. 424]KAG8966602.1 hypothetical protein FRC05_002478 [Tulasnella sp. 425]